MHFRLIFAIVLQAVSTAAVDTSVDLGYSTYIGTALSNGLTQWLGIRYAAAPLGDLRFEPPQDPPHETEPKQADVAGPACLEVGGDPDDTSSGEDCLFLNVMAPSDATSDSELPVFVFIQGGGFSKNADPNINATGLVEAADHDLVVVAMQYRVGPYGFLTDGNNIKANNGLRDQRKVLEWIQDHIAKFGGDPDHVVIQGASAGGASVTFHLTAENGEDKGLFHGAIIQSGSFASMLTIEQSQYQYDNLTSRLGCAGSDSLSCLRGKTARELQEQNFNIPLPGGDNPPLYQWLPAIDNDFVTDYTYRAIAEGNYIRVPTIVGDDRNGGTVFAPRTLSTLEDSNQWIIDQYPAIKAEQLPIINALYPNPNDSCPSEGCYWRRTANIYQEIRFMCPGIYINQAMSQDESSWAYLYDVEDPAQVARGLGVPHTVEVYAIIGPQYSSKAPQSYKTGGINEYVTPVMQGYWTSFTRSLDPNRYRADGTAEWESWNDEPEKRMVIGTGGTTEMEDVDSDLKKRCEFWINHGLSMSL
ncbi:Carboxylesterase type B [Geosmithia morbida]|uniref:Carboxylic ester hydrolase n=1 Tax=Geosmithia morbida TaxID=1094350 RepID=A0A9P4YTT6_9HYPO|nr:Carboxylesterase type B [Geosmithia morbida]KAF4120899.1 Carboxylesterase type B [Geosmithia morbida]